MSILALLADRMLCDGSYPAFWAIYRRLVQISASENLT
jgi:hypothetical protein